MAEKRPTILQIIPELDAGGAERTTVEMAEAIVKADGRVLVLSEGGRLCGEVEAVGGEVIRFAAATKNPLRILTNSRAIARIIRSEAVDLVHARSRAPAWSAYLAARRTSARFVTTYHGIYNEKGRLKRTYNSIMARGDVVIANSDYTAAIVRERHAVDPARIVVVNRGVDVDRFDRSNVATDRIATLRNAWGIAPGRRIILHPARLTRWKGQVTVVEAAAILMRQPGFEDVVVVFAGDAQGRQGYVEELEARSSAVGIEDRVRFVGHVADMPAALAMSEMILIASIEPEAFGRTSVEAQAMGVPVIATTIGAPPFTVLAPPRHPADCATGRHVPPGNAQALASAIAEVFRLNGDERRAMSERARAHARDNYATRTLQHATLSVYDRLLGTSLATRFAAVTAERDTPGNNRSGLTRRGPTGNQASDSEH